MPLLMEKEKIPHLYPRDQALAEVAGGVVVAAVEVWELVAGARFLHTVVGGGRMA
jgi:hypothetical protein